MIKIDPGGIHSRKRPICPSSRTETKGLGLKPNTFSPGLPTNRDRWGSMWPLRLAQAGGPFVVGATNRRQKASTRQQFRGGVFLFF